MGRRSWATPEQLNYLKSFVHLLPQAKGTTGLNMLYMQVYDGFLKRWAPEPMAPKAGVSSSPQELEAQVKERLKTVSVSNCPYSHTDNQPAHRQLVRTSAEEGKVLNTPIL